MNGFSTVLHDWYKEHKRPLPWRSETDPYKIWLSEIILQQTRVDQGMNYYFKFTKNYPTVADLANAPEENVMRDWQGLGYYSRARNLHAAAKHIHNELEGQFPSTYAEIQKLKGVGDYTASAIASFCFGEVTAVVDGNVYRILSRLFGIETPIDSTTGKKEFKQLASELISTEDPGTHNQAIMEFGSQYCTPKNPDCPNCIFTSSCVAFAEEKVNVLPVKSKKIKQKHRYLDYLLLKDGSRLVLRKRVKKDIWQHLHDFPGFDASSPPDESEILNRIPEILTEDYRLTKKSPSIKHLLSHQILHVRFWELETNLTHWQMEHTFITDFRELHQHALPRVVENYLAEHFK